MITQLRRVLKSRAAKNVILWAIILMLGSGLIVTKLFHKTPGITGSITVNGKPISDISLAVKIDENQRQIQFFKTYFGAEAAKYLKMMGISGDPRKDAIETVINQELENQAAQRMNISLSSDFIANKMSEKDFLQKEFGIINFDEIIGEFGVIDQDLLTKYLRMMRLTYSDFETVLLGAINREVLNLILLGALHVPEYELRDRYILNDLARKYSLLKVDFESFFKKAKEKKLSGEQLKDFYDEQNNLKKRYWVPEKRSGTAYIFDADSYGVTVGDEEIKRYYDDNKRKLYVKDNAKVQVRRILFKLEDGIAKDKALEKAQKIRADLVVEPSKFSQIAKEVSDDKETAKDGGLIPFFARGERDKEFEKAAFLLKEDGDISEIVETSDGYEIVQRVKRQDTVYKPLVEVKSEVRKALLAGKFKKLFANDMDEMLRVSGFNKDKFNQLTTKATEKEAIKLHVKKEDKKSTALFRIREQVPAYYFEDDKGVIVVLDEIQERHLPLLDLIKEVVSDDLYEREASKMLQSFLIKAKNEAKSKNLDELKKMYANEYKIELDQTGSIKQSNAEKTAALRSKGYPVEMMFKIYKPGFAGYYRDQEIETSDGYIVKLDEVEAFNEKEYAEKKNEIKQGMLKERGLAKMEEFIAFLRKKATIKTNR